MEEFWTSVLSGLLGSLILVILIFVCAKPKFKLSSEIAYIYNEEFGQDLKGSYLIKVINKSYFIAYDLRGNLEKLTTYEVAEGTNNRAIDLELVDPTTNYLAGRHLFKNTGKSAFLFRTKEDLEGIISASDSKLRFTLMARNGFSGLTKMFVQEYNISAKIKQGHFSFGKSLKIVK